MKQFDFLIIGSNLQAAICCKYLKDSGYTVNSMYTNYQESIYDTLSLPVLVQSSAEWDSINKILPLSPYYFQELEYNGTAVGGTFNENYLGEYRGIANTYSKFISENINRESSSVNDIQNAIDLGYHKFVIITSAVDPYFNTSNSISRKLNIINTATDFITYPNTHSIKWGDEWHITRYDKLEPSNQYSTYKCSLEITDYSNCTIKDCIDIDSITGLPDNVFVELSLNAFGKNALDATEVVRKSIEYAKKYKSIIEISNKYYTLPRMPKKHNSCIVFKCHKYTPGIIRRYTKLCKDVSSNFHTVLSLDITGMTYKEVERVQKLGLPGELHTFNSSHMVNLKYPMTSDYKGHVHDPMWVHPDYGTLHYWHTSQGMYDYYWHIEYDVHFEGSWFDILDYHMNWDTDFIGHHVKDWDPSDQWYWWTRYNNTYSIDPKYRTRVLASFSRFSTRMLRAMDTEYQRGLDNTNEACIGYIANMYGYSIADFTTPSLAYSGNQYTLQNDIEWVRPADFTDKPMKFDFQKNHLYHPVK